MSRGKDSRQDGEDARAEAAEESSAAQPTHYHSRMERSSDEAAAGESGFTHGERGVRNGVDENQNNGVDENRNGARRRVRAQPPEEFTNGEVGDSKRVAGGLPAVLEALKHTTREMGLLRGARTLLRLNQKDGFDCPGCAWPDP